MSKVLINDSTLTAIADAIRTKSGTTETYLPSEMDEAILAIEGYPEIILTYAQGQYACAYDVLNDFLEKGKIKCGSEGVYNINNAFAFCKELTSIDFDVIFIISSYGQTSPFYYTFSNCSNLESINLNIKNLNIDSSSSGNIGGTFINCTRLKTINFNAIENVDFTNFSLGGSYLFSCCYSLRQLPDFCNLAKNDTMGAYSHTFYYCYALEELNIPYYFGYGTAYTQAFDYCGRLKKLTFNNISSKTINSNHTIDLSKYVGWNSTQNSILNYNSGITADKEVTDDTTYQALKDDPDWFTLNVSYSRYNKLSAIETINSLPDTGDARTGTIKFKGAAGELTDGGAINTMTEEEIAVATAKGWTVTFI